LAGWFNGKFNGISVGSGNILPLKVPLIVFPLIVFRWFIKQLTWFMAAIFLARRRGFDKH